MKILMRRLIRGRLIWITTVCKWMSAFTWCPKLPDFTLIAYAQMPTSLKAHTDIPSGARGLKFCLSLHSFTPILCDCEQRRLWRVAHVLLVVWASVAHTISVSTKIICAGSLYNWFPFDKTCLASLRQRNTHVPTQLRVKIESDFGTYTNVQTTLRINAVSPEPSLFQHSKFGYRRKLRKKIRHLTLLGSCACMIKGWLRKCNKYMYQDFTTNKCRLKGS